MNTNRQKEEPKQQETTVNLHRQMGWKEINTGWNDRILWGEGNTETEGFTGIYPRPLDGHNPNA